MTVPILSLTETQCFIALRGYLLTVLDPSVDVIRGQVNLVAEPSGNDFVVMWPLDQERLSTNEVSYFDNIVTASIIGSVATVSTISLSESPLIAGMLLLDGTVGAIAANTILGAQISGSVGGTGAYNVSPAQMLGTTTLYAGLRADLVPVKWRVQLDVHGPNSADNARIIETLFRSEFGTTAFEGQGFDVTPLYADTPRQTPFINESQQYEYRWTIEAHMQLNPVVSTPQQFADQVIVGLIPVEETYPPLPL